MHPVPIRQLPGPQLWTAAAQEHNSLSAAAKAGQCWMKDSCGVCGTWCCPSLMARNVLHTQRQQLLDRNHAVTEAGGEFQLAKSLKAKSQ